MIKSDALAILKSLVLEFPGLVDLESEVNGADLVEALCRMINETENVKTCLLEVI